MPHTDAAGGPPNDSFRWFSRLPDDWDLRRAKFIFKKMERDVREEDEVVTAFRNGRVTLRSNRRTEGYTFSTKEIGYQGIRKGDLVVHEMDAFAGAIGVSDSDGKSTPVYTVLQPRHTRETHSHYYAYLLRHLATSGFINSLSQGIRQRSTDFRYKVLKDLPLPVPKRSVQKSIADFLDRETARIDDLIAQKERLVELLDEKRAALITQAVTKGLDPSLPMKNSGVEWLGSIPATWRVWSIRNLIRSGAIELQDGNHGELHPVADDYVEEGVPFLMASDLRGGKVDLENCRFIPEGLALGLRIGFTVAGDVLLTHKGTIGQSAKVPQLTTSFAILTPQVTYYRVKRQNPVLADYLLCSFRSAGWLRQMKFLAETGTTRDYVGITQQRKLVLAIPPLKEQAGICNFLSFPLGRIGIARNDLGHGIALLKEYRTALISAAVTGQIDVRDAE